MIDTRCTESLRPLSNLLGLIITSSHLLGSYKIFVFAGHFPPTKQPQQIFPETKSSKDQNPLLKIHSFC